MRWPSIAISTIATNIEAGHFLSVAGAAYVDGLALANFELNAIFGIVVATFFFIPLYLRLRVVTISQFFEQRFGPQIALAYAVLMIALYAFLYLGTALFWAAYALDGIFTEMVAWISDRQAVRLAVLIVALGAFSALYTYLGGLRAVVRTDLAQFVLLLGGGLITVTVAVHHLGGWAALFGKTGHLMHLHLPRDHPTVPWIALLGMNLLNLNYWGANQVILQRALAAKSLRDAQVGLLVGGVLKYVMLLIIVIPGIAMAGILADAPLDDPDTVYITLVNQFLPAGLRGLIVCGLFASLMSTVDSIFNSVSTLWSIDIYKRHLRRDASPHDIVRMGKLAILGALVTGVLFAFAVVFFKRVRLFFVEEFSPYSWAFSPADASLQCSFRGDSNQASAYPRLSGGQPSLETVPNTVGLSPSGALPSGHSRGVLVRCRGKGGRPAMAVTTGFQGRTFDVARTGVPCIDLPSPAPCAAADAVFADAKAFLSSSEARQMSESELERELHRRRQDLVRKLLQGHRDQRSPKEAAGPAEDTGGVECSEPREHESHAETTSGTMQVVGLGCARRGHDGLHRLDAALNLLPERYLVEMRRRVTIATASRAPPRTPWKPQWYSTSSTWQRRRRACRHLVRDPMGVDRRTVTFGCSCGGSQPPQAAGALMRTETSHEAREDQRKSPIGR